MLLLWSIVTSLEFIALLITDKMLIAVKMAADANVHMPLAAMP